MPDPVWSSQYSYTQTPEANGFTRVLYGSPVVNVVTGGTPSNRRVEINSDNGSAVFATSSVPSLDGNIGVTAEAVINVTGDGNAGFELTFLDRFIGIQVYSNRITITVPDGNEPELIPTDSNSSTTTIRLIYQTVGGVGKMSLYRNGVSVRSNKDVPAMVNSFQRVLWWGEEGGTQTFRGMRYWTGGAMAPG